VVPSHCRSEGG
jgi:carbon monoxide dehydrogenase subunit G